MPGIANGGGGAVHDPQQGARDLRAGLPASDKNARLHGDLSSGSTRQTPSAMASKVDCHCQTASDSASSARASCPAVDSVCLRLRQS